jgi:hypothetical protein
VALLVATACAPTARAATASDTAAQNAAIQRAFEQRSAGAELTATGTDDRGLSDEAGPSGPHERFIVRLPSGMAVLIEQNLSIAPRVPVAVGSAVTVHGQYVSNAEGGLSHFTPSRPRPVARRRLRPLRREAVRLSRAWCRSIRVDGRGYARLVRSRS